MDARPTARSDPALRGGGERVRIDVDLRTLERLMRSRELVVEEFSCPERQSRRLVWTLLIRLLKDQ